MDATITSLEAGGQVSRALDTGRGEPVVVLHGWGGRIESVAPIVDCLRHRFRVVALDLPGFGGSPTPRGVWGSPDYAVYVRDVLQGMGIRRAHVIGHSFGGKVGMYLAATHPDLVTKLVLVDSSGVKSPPSLEVRAKRLASRAAKVAGGLGSPGRRLRDAVYRRIASRDYRHAGGMRPILVKVVNEDLRALMPRIAAPTLVIWGGRDDDTPLEHGRMMERLIPDAGLVVLEDAGHFSYLDEPQRFCRVVRHFFGAPVQP